MHRAVPVAVIDEADSILIDEARIPLVIAGEAAEEEILAARVDRLVRRPSARLAFQRRRIRPQYRDSPTPASRGGGHVRLRQSLRRRELYSLLPPFRMRCTPHFLLRRDVDYIVKDGRVELVDEFKGRIAQDRRWPAGLHTALEAKGRRAAAEDQGRILGSITFQNLISLYPRVCGMTGTAATQAEEFAKSTAWKWRRSRPTGRSSAPIMPDISLRRQAREGTGAGRVRSPGARDRPAHPGGHGQRRGIRTV